MSTARKLLSLMALTAVLLVSGGAQRPAAAAVVNRTVTTTNDTVDGNDGLVSLREAIAASAAGDSMGFVVTGSIRLNAELVIGRAVTINGPGARKLAIDGRGACRIFRVLGAGSLTVSGLALTNGRAPLEPRFAVNAYSDAYGGALYSEGSVALTACTVSNSLAVGESGPDLEFGGSALGGGIFSLGPLTLVGCTVSGNTARGGSGGQRGASGGGGGIFCQGPLNLLRTTVATNIAEGASSGSGYGGGVLLSSPPFGGEQAISFSTIVANISVGQADFTGGGGLAMMDGDPALRSTLIARNSATGSRPDLGGVILSKGHNLIGVEDHQIILRQTTDRTGTPQAPLDPLLGPFRNNGGPTDTCALLDGSAALDAGEDLSGDADQRGLPRPAGPHSDVGAYERDLPQAGPSFVVTTLEDSADIVAGRRRCTLREALQAANGRGDATVVSFAAGLVGSIRLEPSLGPLPLEGAVTVAGPGARKLAIDGGLATRLFDANSVGAVLSGLTLADGRGVGTPGQTGGAAEGGAVRNTGLLTLNGCELVSNSAAGGLASGSGATRGGSASGGAVLNTAAGELRLNNCTLLSNVARGGNAWAGTRPWVAGALVGRSTTPARHP